MSPARGSVGVGEAVCFAVNSVLGVSVISVVFAADVVGILDVSSAFAAEVVVISEVSVVLFSFFSVGWEVVSVWLADWNSTWLVSLVSS